MARLLLVRHGITEFNTARRFAGHSDIELTAIGYQQAERLRDRLADEKIDTICSSDLKRARLTAEIIASRHKVGIEICSQLREMNYGDAEGLTYEEISRLYPEVAERVVNLNAKLKFPGGESFEEFVARVRQFGDRLGKYAAGQTVLVVGHSGPLRVLVCYLLGIDQSHWWQLRFDNGSLSIVETQPRGAIISLLNDTSHLK